MKSPLPNIFTSTAVKKHVPFIMDQNELKAKFSELFMFLPATLTERKTFFNGKIMFIYTQSMSLLMI